MMFEPLLPVALIVVVAAAAVAWVVWPRPHGTNAPRTMRLLGFVVLGVVLLLRPGSEVETSRQTQLLDIDVVFAVDITTSMVAQDYDGDRPRLAGVHSDIRDLLDEFSGARFSLVTFGADAIVELPFTTDGTAVDTVVDTLRAEPYILATGSSIERPVATLETLLEEVDEAHPDRARILVVLTDGEEVGDGPDDRGSYGDLTDYIDGGLVLGYGTSDGGRMKEEGVFADEGGEYIRDSEGDIAVSRIDEDALQQVADDLGVEYRHRTSPGGLSDALDPGAIDIEMTGEMTTARVDAAWLPAIGLGVLVLWELWEVTAAGRQARRWWAR